MLAIHIWIQLAVDDSGCSAGDTHMDTRGQWVTVAVVLAIHMDTRGEWVTVALVLRYTYGYTWPVW